MTNNITFVSSYLKVYDNDYRPFEYRVKFFESMLSLGINICLFISPEYNDYFTNLCSKNPNLKIIQVMSVDELELYKVGVQYPELCNLPQNRNIEKDTQKYMFLILSKLEFIKKSIDANPFHSEIFCWLDFSLPYVFKNTDTLLKIKKISCSNIKQNKFMYIPGCWDTKVHDIHYLANNVAWRFCGGVLIGDKNSFVHFYNVSKQNFLPFLQQTNTIVWEVNYWAWLESAKLISVTWCPADHDDTIIDLPGLLTIEQ